MLEVPLATDKSRLVCDQRRDCMAPTGVTVISMAQPVFRGDSAQVKVFATVDPRRQPGGMAKTIFLARINGEWTVVRERIAIP